MEPGTEAAEQQRHDQRTTCQTQLNGLRHVQQRNGTQQNTERDTDEDRHQIRLTEFFERITQYGGDLLDRILRTYDHHAIADLKLHSLIGNQIDTGTIDARNVDAVAGPQAKIGESLAVDLRLGNQNTTRNQLRIRRIPLLLPHFDPITDESRHRFAIFGCTDDQYLIPERNNTVAVRQYDRTVGMSDPGNNEFPIDQLIDIGDVVSAQHLVRTLDRNDFGHLVFCGNRSERLILLPEFHPQSITDEDHRENDTDHAQRISYGIAQGNTGVFDSRSVRISLLCCTQSRRVGHRTRKDADHRGNRRTRYQMNHVRHAYPEQNDRRSQADERQPAMLERSEETRADLHTD